MNNDITNGNETGHELKSFFIALFIYGLFLSFLYFWEIRFELPQEPLGVEVNFGTESFGNGNIQTTNKASSSKNNYDVKPPDSKSEKALPKVINKTVVVSKPSIKEVTKPVKSVPEKIITSKVESPVKFKEEVKTPPKVKPKVDPIPDTRPSPTPSKAVEVPKPSPPAPPVRTPDAGSLFGKGKSSGGGVNGTTGNRDGEGGNSNGDDKAGVGDKGNPNGTLDGKSMMGTPGKGGSGATLSGFSGWKKGKLSLPNDSSDETGKIVFKIKVDDQGNVISITAIEKTVSPSVVEFYKRQIERKMSSILDSDGNPPAESVGTITINLSN